MLEHFVREDLKLKANRIMAVTNPLKVIITNYPEGKHEVFTAPNNQENESLGTREVHFARELYIEREDFMLEKPNKQYKRLALGLEVRLFHAYFIKANDVVFDEEGNIVEVHCTYDPQTLSGSGFQDRKPNGTIGYVDATHCSKATFYQFEPLILDDDKEKNFTERINPNSWKTYHGFVEQQVFHPYDRFQFIRDGYYVVDESSKSRIWFSTALSV
jgi:glutaminyl-tRNA synthetase